MQFHIQQVASNPVQNTATTYPFVGIRERAVIAVGGELGGVAQAVEGVVGKSVECKAVALLEVRGQVVDNENGRDGEAGQHRVTDDVTHPTTSTNYTLVIDM